MTDTSILHIGENSPEQVALKLFELVTRVERKSVTASDESELKAGWTKADRAYILATYGECLRMVRHP